MDDILIKWLWLSNIKGINSAKITSLLNTFSGIDEIYNAEAEDYNNIELIRKNDIDGLCDKGLEKAFDVYNKVRSIGARVICFESEEYPESLKLLPDPPYVLYVKGNLLLNSKSVRVGIVGTRDYSDYGKIVTQKLSYELAKSGFIVVSGMARGIDSFAAKAAIKAKMPTIAVIGTGIDVVYPPENDTLMDEICKNGAVITEYPLMSQPLGYHFPERNRIIAALSDALLVTDAPAVSGALITAKDAHNLGKNVFSVPGSIFETNSVGTNNLIKAGAIPMTHPNDMISLYKNELKEAKAEYIIYEEKNIEEKKKTNTVKSQEHNKQAKTIDKNTLSQLGEEERIIVDIIMRSGKISADEIIRKSELATSKVNSLLPMMEILGIIKKYPGNLYDLKDE